MNPSILARRIQRRLKRAFSDTVRMPAPGRSARLPAGAQPGDVPASLVPVLNLPETIAYTGEFGAELILFLPWCAWLSAAGLLQDRRIETYRGMRSFYDELGCKEIIEKEETRCYVPLRRRALPVRDEHVYGAGGSEPGPSPFHRYPDLRAKFRTVALPPPWDQPARPILVVHNKYNHEWDGAPVNYIPLDTLDRVFGTLKQRFQILYIRHGMAARDPAFSTDEVHQLAFDDRGVLARHPEVACFDDVFDAYRTAGGAADVNLFKNALYSRTHHFITAQGGGAHQIALFSGSLLMVLHIRGRETELAYGHGYYGFMANPAPIRVVCRTKDELAEGLPLFGASAIVDGRALPDPAHAGLLQRFSPFGAP